MREFADSKIDFLPVAAPAKLKVSEEQQQQRQRQRQRQKKHELPYEEVSTRSRSLRSITVAPFPDIAGTESLLKVESNIHFLIHIFSLR